MFLLSISSSCGHSMPQVSSICEKSVWKKKRICLSPPSCRTLSFSLLQDETELICLFSMCRFGTWWKSLGKVKTRKFTTYHHHSRSTYTCVSFYSLFSWIFMQAHFVQSILWMLVLGLLKVLFDVCFFSSVAWGLWHSCSQLQVWFGYHKVKMFETEFKLS
jgi:hypothetical protein